MTMTPAPTPPRHRQSAGFTLVEVMISVALVLILILGINQAFKAVTDTVGTGQAIATITRENRAIQPVIYNDMRGIVTTNPPAFIIASSRVSAFRNNADRQGDRDVLPLTIDLNANNQEGEAPATVVGEIIEPATYNYRSHRTDRLAFFGRDIYRRQTGNDGTFANPMTGGEAWIWYGHLRLRNNDQVETAASYKMPGELTYAANTNNFNAADFALGRMVMMLKAEDAAGDINDASTPPVAQSHIDGVTAAGAAQLLRPLAYNSPSIGPSSASVIQLSRYDLAATTIDSYYADVLAAAGQAFAIPAIAGTNPDDWWQRLLYTTTFVVPAAPQAATLDYRFFANRFYAKPLDSTKAARVAPILATGCTQFIVEYAGDYVTQTNAPGDATDGDVVITPGGAFSAPDGIVDYVVERTTGPATEWKRRTRWYGMPRDVAPYDPATTPAANGGPDGHIEIGTATEPPVDVLPVRDVRGLVAFTPPADYGVSPERNMNAAAPSELPAPTASTPANDYLGTGGMLPEARYTCVWGPDVNTTYNPLPKMLRITIVLDEPAGRLAEGQSYEYVVNLP